MSKSDYTEHIARISKGKDSFKMLDVIWTRGLPLDRITTTDVWATDTVSAYLPEMQAFMDRMDQWIWERYHIECEHLCARNKDGSKKTYEQMFYHIPVRRSQSVQVERETAPGRPPGLSTAGNNYRLPSEHRIQLLPETQNCPHPTSKDSRWQRESPGVRNSKPECRPQGFPAQISSWCKKLKIDYVRTPFPDERPTRRGKTNIVEYIGIAADEPDRFGQLNDKKRAPLVEFDIDEDLCGLYCQYAGCLAPTYETSCRDGCWFCHNQGVDQLRNLWRNYPDHWALLMKWDLDSPVTFKADGHTVHDFDRRFRMEEDGVVPMDRTFHWAPVEDYISIFDILRGEI